MDVIATLPKAVEATLEPTFKAYAPLLLDRATEIRSTKKETFSYGPTPRHQLDVYYPSHERANSATSKSVLIFVHGGGLVAGSKNIPVAEDLVYANVGHFFAENYGMTTIAIDYRLMSHGAKFPSGGEDVSLTIDWVRDNLSKKEGYSSINLFLMGNSAGGVHVSTYLFAPDFAESRASIMGPEAQGSIRLRGVCLLGAPLNFRLAPSSRAGTLKAYFGDVESRSPQGLLKSALQENPAAVLPGVKTIMLTGEYDPDDEIVTPNKEFYDVWMQGASDSRNLVTVDVMKGQGHISPPLSLGTGIAREEAWGRQVGEFFTTECL